MTDFIRVYTFALMVLVVVIFVRNVVKRNWDLISWRNLFLLGFTHFYLLGAFFIAKGGVKKEVLVVSVRDSAWGPLALAIAVFLLLFMVSSWIGVRARPLTRIFPKMELPVTTPAVIGALLVLASSALLFSFPFFNNYFGLVVGNMRGQLAGCATGLAVYLLLARRFNPAAWAIVLCTIGVCIVASTVGTAGRRMFLGVVLAVPWMLYYFVWRYRGAASNFARIGTFFVLGVLAIVIYTPFRDPGTTVGSGFTERTNVSRRIDQFIDILSNPTIDPKVLAGIAYTDTVPATLWALDTYPDPHPFEPLKGAKWFFSNPIPRGLWPSKPDALGFEMARVLDTPPGFTMGPGVITHGWVEGGYVGVAGYAIFFGLLVGLADRALRDRAGNPFFLAAMGSAAGNMIALPRGDTPLFLIQVVAGILGSAFIFWVLGLLFGTVWAAFPPLLPKGFTSGSTGEESGIPPEDEEPDPGPAPTPDEVVESRW